MTKLPDIVVLLILSVTLAPGLVGAQGGKTTPEAFPPPVYRPPIAVGAPKGRVGGGSRGETNDVVLQPLAPGHTGRTLQAAPVLYWYLSDPASLGVQITIVSTDDIDPLVDVSLQGLDGPALHGLDLEALGVELKLGMTYQWVIVMASRDSQRVQEVVAGGTIHRTPESGGDLRSRLKDAVGLRRASVLADAGIWYDAVQAIVENRSESGSGTALAGLLEQVGLSAAAGQVRRVDFEVPGGVRLWPEGARSN